MEPNKHKMQRLAGLIKESEEEEEDLSSKFTEIEFDNDLEVNQDNKELFKELEDK